MKGVRVIESRRIYSGGINLRKDKFSLNGKIVDKEIVVHQDSVGIVALRDSSVILVTQYRRATNKVLRSEEHTSELQSRQYLVCRLLLEKKKKKNNQSTSRIY